MNIYQKHMPKSFDDLVIEKDSTRQRLKEYNDGIRNGNLILHGPRGTGKSTAARIIAESRCGTDCDPSWVPTLEGCSLEEEDFISMENHLTWQRLQGVKNPVAIINEIDKLGPAMQAKLQAFSDKHAHHASIIGTTNEPHRIGHSLLDRFDPVEMPAVNPEKWINRSKDILSAEGVACNDNQLHDILSTTNGSIRDVMSTLGDIVIKKRSQSNH